MTSLKRTVMRAGPATLPGSLTYSGHAGKGECQLLIDQSPDRFAALVALFKGGHASEVTIVTEGLTRRDDYRSQWDVALQPRLDVLRVSVEFPLPQSEA